MHVNGSLIVYSSMVISERIILSLEHFVGVETVHSYRRQLHSSFELRKRLAQLNPKDNLTLGSKTLATFSQDVLRTLTLHMALC